MSREYRFLIPIQRNTKPRPQHGEQRWTALKDGMRQFFGGFTISPGLTYGEWKDNDTGETVPDQCREFRVALERHDERRLRAFVRVLCDKFDQNCIYLVSGKRVWFIDCNEMVEPKDYREARGVLRMDGSEPIISLSDEMLDVIQESST